MASVFPVRDAIISAVSPYGVSGAFGSAPALISLSIIAALPFSAASCIGVAPSRFAAETLAPARISRSAVSRSSDAHGPVERGGAVDLRRIDVGLPLQQGAHGVPIRLHGRVRHSLRRGADTAGRQQHDQTTLRVGVSHGHDM